MTIGIPVYNQAEFLAEAIESALAQDIQGEIIICNDGSTDNSLAIAEHYAKKYPVIKVINQVNKGLASARNTIIMNARDNWILFLDADDILQDKCCEKILETIKNNPEADIIAPSLKTFGSSNETIILMPNPTLEDFKTGNRIPYASAIRIPKLLEIGGYSPRMVEGWEDYHLWFNLLTRGAKIVTIAEPLLLYRTKDKSMWTESVQHSEKLWIQIKKDFPW